MTEQILVEIIQHKNSISTKCMVSDPFTTIELIKILGELRNSLMKQTDNFINDMIESHDVPNEIKTLFEKRKTNSSIIELIEKIRTIDNPEEKEQLIKDISGIIKGR